MITIYRCSVSEFIVRAVVTRNVYRTSGFMEKIKYTLFQKPWMPRKLKFVMAFSVILIVIIIFINGTPRSVRLEKIIYVQEALMNIFNLEMELINKNAISMEDQWLPVDDLDGHVYSAYFDPRPEIIELYTHSNVNNEITWAVIRIIAILPTKIHENQIDCIYKYINYKNNSDNHKRIRATYVKANRDNWDLKYSTFFIICDLAVPEILNYNLIYTERQIPSFVTIARRDNEAIQLKNTMKFVNVYYPNWTISKSYEMQEKFMAVCAPVFHHNFDRPLDLVEYIEYYKMLGASHFTFYNSSISSEVNRVLEYYINRDIATVLGWKLPSKYIFERTLRYEGLFAGINDCLYRNSFNDDYEYIGIFGIDEFLVPRIHDNFFELMNYLDPISNGNHKYASFVFRNAFFYIMYQDDYENKDHNVPYLYTQAKTRRVKEPQQPGILSRYIVRGRDTVELGNYKVTELRQGSITYPWQFYELAVNPEVALSHHYSPCEAEETGCYLKNIVVDKTAHKFTKELGLKVAAICSNVFGNAGCPFVKK